MSSTVLAVGGHIGDMDLTAGPTLAKTVLDGGRAIIVALTYGERGHPRMTPDDYRVQKVDEGKAFADAIGAEFHVFDISDGFLEVTDEVAGRLAALIRETTPDVLIAHWNRSIHRDHEHAAQLAERARFLASLPTDDGTLPTDAPRHGIGRFLHAENWEDADGFVPDTYVPIPDEPFEVWRAAIQGQAFARGETYGFRYIDYYTALLTMRGCLAGHSRAAAFKQAGSASQTLAGP
ncbi:PIG-L deacetylase family protein [Microlunatus soli]|uniref:N-acetylglucosaminyl deacetylase, LmbE family n=1 Tax=Microlunatus soli TaxID=630515 RepID=A0A1H1XIE7_9ACTN|nr:PIG-L family deacetylase [Microlunatus soli]SDT09044.1 N-acetylglucosaminyl deacetylase, LmbE family [Microlunatus soli]